MSFRVLVASYSRSIFTLEFDPKTRSLTRLSSVEVGHHPSWIIPHPKDSSLVFTGLEQADGRIVAIKYDASGKGRIVAEVPSGGADPCSLLITEWNELFIANYSSGDISVLSISSEHPYILQQTPATTKLIGSGPNLTRQTTPHPHQVYASTPNTLLVPDLGGDRVYTFQRDNGWRIASSLTYNAGSGPRHVAIYNDVLYTLLELSSELSAHRNGTHLKTIATMSNPPPRPSDMLAAELLIPPISATFPTPYIYVSNRNDPSPEGDLISIFSIEKDGTPKLVKEVRSGLKHLRGMSFGGPDDRWLVAGGVFGGGVRVFERTEAGRNLAVVVSSPIAADSPTGFLWI